MKPDEILTKSWDVKYRIHFNIQNAIQYIIMSILITYTTEQGILQSKYILELLHKYVIYILITRESNLCALVVTLAIKCM